jgi:hypothetical protein
MVGVWGWDMPLARAAMEYGITATKWSHPPMWYAFVFFKGLPVKCRAWHRAMLAAETMQRLNKLGLWLGGSSDM